MSLRIYGTGASKLPVYNSYRAIVKIQVSIGGQSKTLIYNKNKTFIDERPIEFGKKLLKNDLKGYFKVKIKSGNIRILERISDRDW